MRQSLTLAKVTENLNSITDFSGIIYELGVMS